LNCKVPAEELKSISLVGFPSPDRIGNKEKVRDAFKPLVNGMNAKDAEEVGAKSAALVDCYHDVVEACWGAKRSEPFTTVTGELDGWRWALSLERFDRWVSDAPSTTAGLAVAPTTSKPASFDVNALPPVASMVMGPPPSAQAQAKVAASSASDDDLTPGDPLGPAPGTEKRKSKPR